MEGLGRPPCRLWGLSQGPCTRGSLGNILPYGGHEPFFKLVAAWGEVFGTTTICHRRSTALATCFLIVLDTNLVVD